MNKRVTLNQKLNVSRLTGLFGLFGLLAIVLVAAFFINVPTTSVRAQSSPMEEDGGVAPSLGVASTFGVLAATTVTNTGLTVVTGNLGVAPGSAVTGFPPGVVVGTIFTGAGSMAGQAQADATVAYNNLAGQACDTILTGQDLGGLVLGPGVYCFSSSAFLTGILTLDGQGNPNAAFVFKIGSTLVTASASQVLLINGAQACNVFFQVGSSATLGTGTRFQGNILALTSITVTTGTNLNGRAIALNGAVTLDTNMITNCVSVPQPTPTPTPTPPPPTPTPTPTPTPQQVCVPTTTVSEGDLFPGGLASFGVTSGPGSVMVDHVNAGTGTQSFTVVSATNAVVSIPPFTPGTFDPITATFTVPNPNLTVDFTLRAASTFHAIFIRVRCVQQVCTPITTVTEGDLFPGGLASFGVSSGPNSVTVDHVNAGTGTQSLTVVSATNAVVNIPPFTPGTFNPITVTYTIPNPNLPVDFTLRAASTFHSIFIRVRCGDTQTLNTFSGRATAVNATLAGINATLVDTGELPAAGGFIIAPPLLSANILGGALTTGLLNANTQGFGDQSRSQATVENFILNVGGNTITGVLVADSSQCTCTGGGFHQCEGGVLIAILRINGVQIPISGVNQTINLPGGGTVIINEQIVTGSGNAGAITVNGVHIFIPPVIPGTPPVANVILASAHSDIVCATQ